MSESIVKVSVSRELTADELREIEEAFRNEYPDSESVSARPSQSMGLAGAELFLSITISFGTSIAAAAAYDFGKFLIQELKKRGVEASEADDSE